MKNLFLRGLVGFIFFNYFLFSQVEEIYKLDLENQKQTKLEFEVELKEGEELVFFPVFLGPGLCACKFTIEGLKIKCLEDGKVYQLPEGWRGKEEGSSENNPLIVDGKPLWRLDRIWAIDGNWKDVEKRVENYIPMIWGIRMAGEGWYAPEEQSHGGQPSASVKGGNIVLTSRTAWPGKAGNKFSALIFIVPKKGKYSIEGMVNTKIFDGGTKIGLKLLKKEPSKK